MLSLFLAEFKRSLVQLRRYASELIGGVVGTTIIFYGLFLSTRYIAGPGLQFGDRLDSIIVGYVLWALMLFIMGDIAGGLQQEARTGTLEQLFLSPYRASTVFLLRAVSSLILNLLINFSILLLIMALTGSKLAFPPTLLLPLLAVLLGAYGIAFAMGALALTLKQVQQVLSVFQFGLIFLFTVPVESWTGSAKILGWLLPMAPGAGLLRGVMARGVALDWGILGVALVNGTAYLAFGVLLFGWAERRMKRLGALGGY